MQTACKPPAFNQFKIPFLLICFKRIWPIRYCGIGQVISWEEIISLISVLCLTPLLVKIKLMVNQSSAPALPPLRGEWIPFMWRHQCGLSHWFLISVSQWNRLANRAELCNSMQLQAAAHKSLRVLILRRLNLKTHPESSTRRGGRTFASALAFHLLRFVFFNFISEAPRIHTGVLLRCGRTQLCLF